MKLMQTKKQLEIALSKLKTPERPNAGLDSLGQN